MKIIYLSDVHHQADQGIHEPCAEAFMKTGIFDKNGVEITLGDTLQTFDKTGKKWVGEVVLFDNTRLMFKKDNEWHPAPYPQFAFRSNYDTVLSPYIGATFEIIKK